MYRALNTNSIIMGDIVNGLYSYLFQELCIPADISDPGNPWAYCIPSGHVTYSTPTPSQSEPHILAICCSVLELLLFSQGLDRRPRYNHN